MGDFNEILYNWEKLGTRMAENYRLMAFSEFLNACFLMDLESKGCSFTWANNRDGDAFVKKRLDRVLCNVEWRVLFPNAKAYALPTIGSDHSPLLLSLFAEPVKRKREFKFEAFWLEDAECVQIVKEAWQSPELENAEFQEKMHKVTVALTKWSRKKFMNAQRRINALKKELEEITNSQNVLQDKVRVQQLTKQIDELWKQEEMYLGDEISNQLAKMGGQKYSVLSCNDGSKEAEKQNFHVADC